MCVHYRCIVSSNVFLLVCKVRVRRNDHAIDDALESVAQALQGQQNQVGEEVRRLGKFQRNNLAIFKGIYGPEDGQT